MILTFTKAQILAMAQSGVMNITSVTHWEICKDLQSGKDEETVARLHHKSPIQVYRIHKCKCPEV